MAYAFFGRRARASVKGENREDGGSQWIRNENEKQKAKGRSNRWYCIGLGALWETSLSFGQGTKQREGGGSMWIRNENEKQTKFHPF